MAVDVARSRSLFQLPGVCLAHSRRVLYVRVAAWRGRGVMALLLCLVAVLLMWWCATAAAAVAIAAATCVPFNM